MPEESPLTIPVLLLIVAMAGLPLAHTPLPVGSERVMEVPWQKGEVPPAMAAGVG